MPAWLGNALLSQGVLNFAITSAGIGFVFNCPVAGSSVAQTRVSEPSTASCPSTKIWWRTSKLERRNSPMIGMHLDLVAEFGRHHEFGARIDQRHAEDFEGLRHLVRLHAERGLEQVPARRVEKLEEAAVEDDAGRVAIGPVDGELPLVDEVAHEMPRPIRNRCIRCRSGVGVSNLAVCHSGR